MSRLVAASQMSAAFNAALAGAVPDLDIISVPDGAPTNMPRHAQILIAAPFRKAGGLLPATQPPGWPFGLEWVQLFSAGLDYYPAWLSEGPTVTSAKGSSAVPLAEFVLAAIFAAAKSLPEIWIHRLEDWSPTPLTLVSGSTLGLVGFGSLGEALAPRAQALGMNILAVRRSCVAAGVPGVELLQDTGELFARSDHVVLAAPATPQTEGLVGRQLLARAKPGLHLVNVARGSLIDDQALLEAIDDGRVRLATLDVTHPEPLPADHPFYRHPQVRLSPHTSVFTEKTRQNMIAHFAANVERFRRGVPLNDPVDFARGY